VLLAGALEWPPRQGVGLAAISCQQPPVRRLLPRHVLVGRGSERGKQKAQRNVDDVVEGLHQLGGNGSPS